MILVSHGNTWDSTCNSKRCFCHGHACLVGEKANFGIAGMRTGKHIRLQYLCNKDRTEKSNTAVVLCKELGFSVYETSQRPVIGLAKDV